MTSLLTTAPRIPTLSAPAPVNNWAFADLSTFSFGPSSAQAMHAGNIPANLEGVASSLADAVPAVVADVAIVGLLMHGLRRMLKYIYS